MRGNRWPQIGDILVVNNKHRGMITRIVLDKYNHPNNVFVAWQTDPSWDYNIKHGFCGINIHNLRNSFKIFRAGEEIR